MATTSAFWLFAALAVAGTLLPLAAFLPWAGEHGLDPARFLADLFANRISSFFAWDVIVSALVTIALILIEGRRIGMRAARAIPIVATLLVGVSSGLPLFLAQREMALARGRG